MTARFPDLLPLPLVEDYSITPNEAIIRTQMESGTATCPKTIKDL